jgi:uncharacterized membrane protein YdjX (TVP38/TMEM64 family)
MPMCSWLTSPCYTVWMAMPRQHGWSNSIATSARLLLAFGVVRRPGFDAVQCWASATRLLDRAKLQAALAGIVFGSRLVPFISLDAVSYAAGLTALRGWRFALATLAGVIPVSVALVWFGERMVEEGGSWIGLAVLILGVVTLVPLALRVFRRKRLPKRTDQ